MRNFLVLLRNFGIGVLNPCSWSAVSQRFYVTRKKIRQDAQGFGVGRPVWKESGQDL